MVWNILCVFPVRKLLRGVLGWLSILYQYFLFDLGGSRGGTRCVLYLPLGDLDRGGLGPGCLTTGGGGVGLVNGIYGNSTLVVLTTFGKGGIFGFTV